MLYSNKFCSDVPTQVQALSSGVANWYVTTGNSFGTVCGWQSYMADSRFPTFDGSTSSYFWYAQSSITGTMPTEVSESLASLKEDTFVDLTALCSRILVSIPSPPSPRPPVRPPNREPGIRVPNQHDHGNSSDT